MMVILLSLLVIVLLFYYNMTKNYNYWKIRNVKHDKPVFYFGTMIPTMFALKSFSQFLTDLYNKYYDEKLVGMYVLNQPLLMVKDLDIIKRILTQDFLYFYNRGGGRNKKVETLHRNAVLDDGDSWKLLRLKLTPMFTSAKLKNMFHLIVRCSQKLQTRIQDIVDQGGECNIYEVIVKYTCEFVGTCGFGIDMDVDDEQRALFNEVAQQTIQPTQSVLVKKIIYEICPFVRPYLYVNNPQVRVNITKIIKEVMRRRNYKPSARNDYMDCLIKLYNDGVIRGESIDHRNPDGTPVTAELKVDIELLAAQVFIFFAAGFETSTISTSYALHQLALNPEVQRKAQEDVDKVLSKYNGEICYDAIAEMTFLKMILYESMRMFSPAIVVRQCTKQYTIPELNITIDRGVKIAIPVQAIQNDPKYFENPNKFDPERFTPENVNKRHKYTFLSYGDGPRNCVGYRMGEMQSMAGLAAILHKYSVEPSANSRQELKVDSTRNVVQGFVGGLPLTLKLRDN